jgi:hypothetical protein
MGGRVYIQLYLQNYRCQPAQLQREPRRRQPFSPGPKSSALTLLQQYCAWLSFALTCLISTICIYEKHVFHLWAI